MALEVVTNSDLDRRTGLPTLATLPHDDGSIKVRIIHLAQRVGRGKRQTTHTEHRWIEQTLSDPNVPQALKDAGLDTTSPIDVFVRTSTPRTLRPRYTDRFR